MDTSSTSDEEVKYTVDGEGHILGLSKATQNALGEAIGINYIASGDKKHLIERLAEVHDQEYFEGGIEKTIQQDGVAYLPVDISAYYAVEVDFADDLVRANESVQRNRH